MSTAASSTGIRRRTREDLVGIAVVATLGVAGFLLLPDELSFLTRIATTALFVISVDLVLGYAGVATLGHAVLYGAGAYAAGHVCLHFIADPLALLAVGVVAGMAMGVLQGAVVAYTVGLPQVVLSIATVQLAHAVANRAVSVTGGSDGVAGITPDPLFGVFEFDLWGHTAYWLSLAALLVVLALTQRLVRSPFGLLCRGIKADEVRIRAMGGRVYPALLKMYALSGAIAGLAGALTAVTTGVVGLNSVSFDWSAVAVIMLILGGAGSLYGAILGTVVFMGIEHTLSTADPYNWIIFIGVLLVATVFLLPRGLRSLANELPRFIRIGGGGSAPGLKDMSRRAATEEQA